MYSGLGEDKGGVHFRISNLEYNMKYCWHHFTLNNSIVENLNYFISEKWATFFQNMVYKSKGSQRDIDSLAEL